MKASGGKGVSAPSHCYPLQPAARTAAVGASLPLSCWVAAGRAEFR